ncbi:hypothetical protein CEP51_016888, partial [Fusarium floridanum]
MALKRALKLFNGSSTSQAPATQSRQRAARKLLTSIGRDPSMGVEVFFLCILAISISDLSSAVLADGFFKSLQPWWQKVKHPAYLQKLLSELHSSWSKVTDALDIEWPTRITSPSATWIDDPDDARNTTEQPSLPGRNPSYASSAEALPHMSAQEMEMEQPQDEERCSSDEMEADNGVEVIVQDDASEGTATNPVQPVFQFQRVYRLKQIDAIRVLSTIKASECDLRLTVPLSSGATPFITFHCSQKL